MGQIEPKKKPGSDSGLYIGTHKPDGSVLEFWIGRDYIDKEVFIEDFSAKITEIHESDDNLEFYAGAEAEVRHTKICIKKQ